MTEIRLVTAGDLCKAAEMILTAQIPGLLEALGLDEAPEGAPPGYKPLVPPLTWTQLPTLEALQTANVPAAAVTSTGIVGTPRTSRLGVDATFRLRIGVFDRGQDYNATADRIRTWAALLRGLALKNPTLGGIAAATRLVGESYRQFPQTGVARTLGGCAVDLDVDVRNIADLTGLTAPGPIVVSPDSVVTVHPPHQE